MAADPLASTSKVDLLERLRAAERKPPMEKALFDGWETIRQLGSGSHGRCYLMRRPDSTLLVHKRVPVSHMPPADQEVAEREVNILASFSHPYIITYHRAFVRQGQLCIAMEHAVGGDLHAHLLQLRAAGKRLPAAATLDWFVQLLLALDYVHGYKVLHRDIALKNVFLASDGTVKLGDFGVARVLDSTQGFASTKVGTPCYIAPERCEGRPYTFLADVWAMGCLLYELLTLRPAFSADTIPQVSEQILSGKYAPFEEADEAIPPEVRELIAQMLTVSLAQRPSLATVLEAPCLQQQLHRHAAVRAKCVPGNGRIASVEIPLIGYEGASKTKFSERPVFVDGGGRIVDEANQSAHDAKLLGARQRRQRQLAEKRGGASSAPSSGGGGTAPAPAPVSSASASGPNFNRVQNFGAGGVVGFLVQGGATGGGAERPADIS